jgi:hypothetical protein
MRYLCLPTPVTYVSRLNTVRTKSPLPTSVRMAHPTQCMQHLSGTAPEIARRHFSRRTTTAVLDGRQKKREPKRAPVLILREMPAQT